MEAQFHAPRCLDEACDLLAGYPAGARVLAGGTDLMVQINRRRVAPTALIYIGGCGLDFIREQGDVLAVGAAATFADILRSPLAREAAPLLVQAARGIGSPAIRNAGTIGGNLANASPAADAAVALLALGARLRLVSARGERTVEVAHFFSGPGQTVLAADELVAEALIPKAPPGEQAAYRKIGQRQADVCAVASAAVVAETVDGHYRAVSIALGSVAPVPLLANRAMAALAGGRCRDDALIEHAAQAAAGEAQPIDDLRASAWYRREASGALVRAALVSLRKEQDGPCTRCG